MTQEMRLLSVEQLRFVSDTAYEAGVRASQDELRRLQSVETESKERILRLEGALTKEMAINAQLLEACQTFAEWLRREDSGFDHKTHDRKTPEGEAAWREWFYENLRICNLAQEQARAAIAAAKVEA